MCEVCATEVRAFGLLYGIWSETDVALADALDALECEPWQHQVLQDVPSRPGHQL